MMFSRVALRAGRASAVSISTRGLVTTAARRTPGYVSLATGVTVGAGALAFGITEAKSEGSFFGSLFGGKPAISGEWQKVAEEIKELLEDNANDGPFFIRLAWHCAGSYNKVDGSGGSNGATMRFPPEADHGGNAGLGLARDLLEPIKAAHPELSYADIYTFAGKVSAEVMGSPTVNWTPGRKDFEEGEGITPDGRLPDGAQGAEHLRHVFYRMGFNDQEIVALSGAHALGFCHDDRSGFSGPWTDTPTELTNKYYTFLLNKKWVLKQWDGPAQFVDAETGTLMMLPTDMCLITDTNFRKYVDAYAADEAKFKADFAKAFATLLELGVPRK